MFTVYVLYSEKYNKHYTGFSSDFEKRLKSHNELGIKGWSIKYKPWIVVLKEEYTEKNEAIKREKWLKSGIGRKYIKELKH